MLEFIRERAQGWFAKIVLGLIAVTFALWGVESYFQGGGGRTAVAEIDDRTVSENEFDRMLRDQVESLGRQADRSIADDPKFRKSVLDRLISQHLVTDSAVRAGMVVGPGDVRKAAEEIPAFQDENGKFSYARLEQLLRSRGLAPEQFEALLREELIIGQLRAGIMAGAFVPRSVAERLVMRIEEKREISVATLPPGDFASKVTVTPPEVRGYFDSHPAEFRIPEKVRAEYVVLSAQELGEGATVADADVEAYYKQNPRRFAETESRRVSHILVRVEPGASPDAKAKALAEANGILAEVKKDPARFADVAKARSQDPGSAPSGGDLGFNPRGTMVKAFDAAVFSMKDGEIRGPVESDFGFHIIRLTGIKGAGARPLEAVRGEIVAELKKQAGLRKFAEAADTLSNLSYDQPQSLKPVADALKLEVHTTDWVDQKTGAPGLFGNRKLLDVVFSEESLKERHNTEAVEVAPSTLVVARVVDHRPAAIPGFETVEANLAQKLRNERAAKLAQESGAKIVASLRKGEAPLLVWSPFQVIDRQGIKGLTPAAATQVFRADPAKLPAYHGFATPDGGFSVVRVTRVVAPPAPDQAKVQQYVQQVSDVAAARDLSAYVAGLRAHADIRIHEDRLVKKQ